MSIQIFTLEFRFWITCLSHWHQALLWAVGFIFLWQENETFSKCSGTFFFNAHATAKTRRANMNNVVYGAYAPKAQKRITLQTHEFERWFFIFALVPASAGKDHVIHIYTPCSNICFHMRGSKVPLSTGKMAFSCDREKWSPSAQKCR